MYLTLTAQTETEQTVRRSRFITTLFPAADYEAFLRVLEDCRKRYPDATHHCYAYVGVPEANLKRFSDAGEPAGTAGQPILAVLEKNGLYAAGCVVTRYFGGVKLGAGGLTQAYAGAAAEAVKNAQTAKVRAASIWEAVFAYSEHKMFESVFKESIIRILDTQYADSVTVTFAVPAEDKEQTERKLSAITAGKGEYKIGNETNIIFER